MASKLLDLLLLHLQHCSVVGSQWARLVQLSVLPVCISYVYHFIFVVVNSSKLLNLKETAEVTEAGLSTEEPRLARSRLPVPKPPPRPNNGGFRELLLSKKETAPCESGYRGAKEESTYLVRFVWDKLWLPLLSDCWR